MARTKLLLALVCLAAAALATGADARKMVGVYELKKGDFSVKVTNWGAILMSVVLPDSKGTVRYNLDFCLQLLGFSCLRRIVSQETWLMSSLAKIPSPNTS